MQTPADLGMPEHDQRHTSVHHEILHIPHIPNIYILSSSS